MFLFVFVFLFAILYVSVNKRQQTGKREHEKYFV
jgi:preprotein translocase subunit YajC